MKRNLMRSEKQNYFFGYIDGEKIIEQPSYIRGNLTGISGDLTGIRGNLTGISGDLDDCEISTKDRENGINIEDLIEESFK